MCSSQYPLKGNPSSDFYLSCSVLSVLLLSSYTCSTWTSALLRASVSLWAPRCHRVSSFATLTWPRIAGAFPYLSVFLSGLFLGARRLSTLEARLVPTLFSDRTSTADSTGPGARPPGETRHGPPTASAFGGSTLGEQRSRLRPPLTLRRRGLQSGPAACPRPQLGMD